MSTPDDHADPGRRRRRLLLLLVGILVLLGAGIGGFILSPSEPGDDPTTPTPTDTATPTDDGTGPSPVTPGETETLSTPQTGTPGDPPTETPSDPGDTPTATPTRSTGGGGNDDDDDSGGGGGPTTPSPGLELGDDGPLLSAANLAPGDTGQGSLTIRNTAGEDGELTVSAVDINDTENGIVDPEADVDTSPNQGELSKHLMVRVAFEDGAGDREYVLDTDSSYVQLSELRSKVPSAEYALASGEEVTLATEWKLPATTGNIVQSDEVSVDVGLTLQSTD